MKFQVLKKHQEKSVSKYLNKEKGEKLNKVILFIFTTWKLWQVPNPHCYNISDNLG